MSLEEADSEGLQQNEENGVLIMYYRKVITTVICSHVENAVNESGDLAEVISAHLANYNKMKEITDNPKENFLNKKETGLHGFKNSKPRPDDRQCSHWEVVSGKR